MSRHGIVVAKNAVATIAVAGLLTVGAAVALAATAAADDPPPPDVPVEVAAPAPPVGPVIPGIGAPLGPNGLSLLGQTGSSTVPGSLGVPDTLDTTALGLLGQNQAPAAPGAGVPGAPPNLNAFNNAYVLPQNEKPAAPGQGSEVGVAPGDENADLNRRGYVGQLHDLYRNGNLRGALLGQLPQQQLGEPLPGTAPPPGTNVPPGLVQFLPDPEGAPGPGAPPVVPPAAPAG